ncbi:MAG: tRNA guanosine(34) transglycosylase Tgt [Armatimonadota bacterium]
MATACAVRMRLEASPLPCLRYNRPRVPRARSLAGAFQERALFELLKTAPDCAARRGRLRLAHAVVETPTFMPVGTQGTVKALSQQEVWDLGYRLILGNTYHLHLRPGEALIQRAGGLHRFIGWDGAILTDSGGFQVFSLEDLRKITEEGALFRSHIDGSEHFFTPENVVDIQLALGSDILMAFDECAPYPCEHSAAEEAMERTHRWAARCRDQWLARRDADPAVYGQLFGIVQGSVYPDLRTRSAHAIAELETPGIAIGGVSVGETRDEMFEVVEHTAPLLPQDKPRYLMGVGTPVDLLDAVLAGIDMFDCVLPTRLGRNGSAYTSLGRINVKNSRYTDDFNPIDPSCREWCCRHYSGAYIRHLYKSDEILAARILSYHNVAFYARLMEGVRQALEEDRFPQFRREFLARYRSRSEA